MKAQAPKIFGKLLYGSKFHRLKQSRGQQGIGISAAAMYGQLTTGQPIRVTSPHREGQAGPLLRDPDRHPQEQAGRHRRPELAEWHQEHGTRVELEIVANWQAGAAVREPLRRAHRAREPARDRPLPPPAPGSGLSFPRATDELPKEALEIKPHPHGVELGALMLMAARLEEPRRAGLPADRLLARVAGQVADEIVKRAGVKGRVRPRDLAEDRVLAEKLHKAIGETKIMAPPTNCLVAHRRRAHEAAGSSRS